MEIPDDTSIFKFKSPKKLVGGTEIELSGELVFTWPYKWDPEIVKRQPLVDRLAGDILDFLNKRLDGKHRKDPMVLITDTLWMGIYSVPPSWREEALDNHYIYRKLLLYNTYFYIFYNLDDTCEKMSGEPQHPQYVKSVGRLLYKLFLLGFRRVQDFQECPYYVYLSKTFPMIENYLLLLFDIVEEMETRYELTSLKMKGLANAVRYLYELQTWYGTEKLSHLFNLPLRHLLRTYNVGFDILIEFTMVLDGCYISDKVRQDVYWSRQYESARTLGYLINDILSAPKELAEAKRLGKIVDNTVLIYNEMDMTFEEAQEKTIQLHNKKVHEFRNEVKSMLEDKDLLFDFNKEEKIIYFRSLDFLGICLSHLIQTHLVMKRYKLQDVHYEFVPYTKQTSSLS